MLVQKQTPERLKRLLLIGGIPIVLLMGYVLYLNLSGDGTLPGQTTTAPQKSVPKDFGQGIFRDARFYGLVPKAGTNLITQANVVAPETELAPPRVEAFDVQTGGTVLFTWKTPERLTATFVRVNRVLGDVVENLATLPATATSFLYTGAPNGQAQKYSVHYVRQVDTVQSPQVAAHAGTASGGVSVVAADGAGVRLQWLVPEPAAAKRIEVYRSDAVGTLGKRVANLEPGVTSYDDPQGREGLNFYTLIWVGGTVAGQLWEDQVTSTDSTPPKAPDFIQATYLADRQVVRVSWAPSSSPDVTQYQVYKSDHPLTLGILVGTKQAADVQPLDNATSATGSQASCANDLCLEDTAIKPGEPVYYTVIAVDRSGNQSSVQDLGRSGRANPFLTL